MVTSLISTIIPVFNRPGLLVESVNSVLEQSYRPIEIIIVNDGSTDDTGEVADKLASCHNEISVVHQTQSGRGPGLAREAGRLQAQGEFIQYLDSDDLLLPGKFDIQVAKLKESQGCDVCYGKTIYTKQGEPCVENPWKRTGEKIETMFPGFIQERWWGTSTPLYRKSVCDAVGPWKDIRNEEDWEYDCRIAAMGVRLAYCDEFVSHERGHVGPRLSRESASDPAKLVARARARIEIWQSAVKAGLERKSPEVQHFARYAFLLARQCGEAGLAKESKALFDLSRQASTPERAKGFDFRIYGLVANIIGWTKTAKISACMDRYR